MMFRIILLNLISILLQNPIESFVVTSSSPSAPLVVLRATGTQNDILKVPYEIEPIGIRIGHGFDIHRMVPREEAGQPVVIAGVEIIHSDQKVRLASKLLNGLRVRTAMAKQSTFRQ